MWLPDHNPSSSGRMATSSSRGDTPRINHPNSRRPTDDGYGGLSQRSARNSLPPSSSPYALQHRASLHRTGSRGLQDDAHRSSRQNFTAESHPRLPVHRPSSNGGTRGGSRPLSCAIPLQNIPTVYNSSLDRPLPPSRPHPAPSRMSNSNHSNTPPRSSNNLNLSLTGPRHATVSLGAFGIAGCICTAAPYSFPNLFVCFACPSAAGLLRLWGWSIPWWCMR